MALPILDGNQTAATLSTVLTGGEHIPAHTVVSLGSQAITDVRSAVSGSVVSISNFPSTQTIAGTVTANAQGTITAGMLLVENANNSFPNQNAPVQLKASPNNGSLRVRMDYSASADPSENGSSVVGNTNATEIGTISYIKARVVAGSVTIGSLPAISGTVTVGNATTSSAVFVKICGEISSGGPSEPKEIITDSQGMLYARLAPSSSLTAEPVIYDPVGGGSYINVRQYSGTSTTIGSLPNGALATRFGSVTTASVAQLTSCVTNTSRKYLLAQNISAGTVTIGIGFSPTTTQGVQLPAGGGLTFDAFCPTGAVYWLGAVTGAAFTILEG